MRVTWVFQTVLAMRKGAELTEASFILLIMTFNSSVVGRVRCGHATPWFRHSRMRWRERAV